MAGLTATSERKRVLELAQAAARANTGVDHRPGYPEMMPMPRFLTLAKKHPAILRYEGAVSDRAGCEIYREARGSCC